MLALGKPPVYNRAAMDLSAKQRREFEDAGRRPHWRFRLENSCIYEAEIVHPAAPLYLEFCHVKNELRRPGLLMLVFEQSRRTQ